MNLTKEQLELVLEKASGIKIGIVGDICLDRYVIGDMAGISREAPVPIINIESDDYLPGGAGNTTLNVGGITAQALPLGVIGADLAAEIIKKEFDKRNISSKYMILEEGRHTQSYSKVYASAFHGQQQQVARFDQKNSKSVSAESEKETLENLHKLIDEADAVIVADYAEVEGTGTLTDRIFNEICKLAKEKKIITIGDSRERLPKMQYFTAVVPNDIEVTTALFPNEYSTKDFDDDGNAREYAIKFQEQSHCDHVIMTRGEKGAMIASADGSQNSVPTVPSEGEIDVTGAGDCFASALAVSLSVGLDIVAAVELANLAAGITVRKLNTTGVATPEEIRAEYEDFLKVL
jgi:rfaE bifunctional protein kinase chain/domain